MFRAPLGDRLELAARQNPTGWIVGAGEHQRPDAGRERRVESVEVDRAVRVEAHVDQLHTGVRKRAEERRVRGCGERHRLPGSGDRPAQLDQAHHHVGHEHDLVLVDRPLEPTGGEAGE